MNDFHYKNPALDQRASATLRVLDYLKGKLTAAAGSILVADNDLITEEATATGSITYGAPDNGDTVIVNGETFTKVAAAPGAGEFTSITELEALVEAVTGVNSSEDGTTVSITAAVSGTAGNAITLALGEGNTGTLAISGATLTGGADGDTITIGATTKKFGTDITKGGTAALTAEAIKDVVHALAAVNATRTSETVNIVAATPGTAGNSIALTTTAPGLTLSGATLSGGVAAVVITLDGTALTEGTGFNFATDDETSAAALAVALGNVAGFTATAVGDTVTVRFSTPGTGGNAKTLTTSNALAVSVSGATLSGGVAATYTDWFDVHDAAQIEETLVASDDGNGASPTLNVTPQRSVDGGDTAIDDPTAFTQVTTSDANETLEEGVVGGLRRYKLVTGGTNPVYNVAVHAFPKR